VDLICRFHKHKLQAHQCGSILLQQMKAPVETVWSFTCWFDKPQVYKSLIQTCDVLEGNGGVGTVREIHLVSSIPVTSSIPAMSGFGGRGLGRGCRQPRGSGGGEL
jgi:abscisic acid receptor (PYR/PYL family)